MEDIDTADLIVFDLGPGDGIAWPFVTETALALRDFLQRHGLESWLKTSGGKGLHLMFPLKSPLGTTWRCTSRRHGRHAIDGDVEKLVGRAPAALPDVLAAALRS